MRTRAGTPAWAQAAARCCHASGQAALPAHLCVVELPVVPQPLDPHARPRRQHVMRRLVRHRPPPAHASEVKRSDVRPAASAIKLLEELFEDFERVRACLTCAGRGNSGVRERWLSLNSGSEEGASTALREAHRRTGCHRPHRRGAVANWRSGHRPPRRSGASGCPRGPRMPRPHP